MPRSPLVPLRVLLTALAVHAALAVTTALAQDGTASAGADEARHAMQGFRLAPGLAVDLVAAEPALQNPVAFTIDAQGRFFVVETHRLKHGVFDTRDHEYWLHDDLACLTVDDRVAMYHKHMAQSLAELQQHDERIRLLTDRDGDGTTEHSTVFAGGFSDLADGIAAGVLALGDDVFFTCIPKLWRLQDQDRDGQAEVREVVHDGFGVHVSLIGHDLHGLRIGPDRRLWFSIGDRGFHVETDGGVLAYPHTGAVLRCELDGSRLEVVHAGLRNPQELAFDERGNLFTGDNNSDAGDRARWVYVVEGGDSGWHIGYQWMPTRGAWNEEKLWHTQFDGQAAFLVPPSAHIGHGPSGVTFYPGTGLPDRYRGSFFLCDFRASAATSGIHALKFQPKGAGFELCAQEELVWNIVPTDVEVGPDGAVYVLDWVEGWDLPQKGRIYRVHAPELAGDASIAETGNLLRADLAARPASELCAMLRHPDMRVRQRVEFALVDRCATDPDTVEALARTAASAAAASTTDQLARLHAIWALGILGRGARRDVLGSVMPLLQDGDDEVRTQAAKVLGDGRFDAARPALIGLCGDSHPRPRFQAAIALGRIGGSEAIPALLALLRDDGGRDPYLRHAAAVGLAGTADETVLLTAADDPSPAVRMGVLLALRRLDSPAIARFLDDQDPLLVVEAARAIYEVPIDDAMPALAALAAWPGLDDTALLRRVLNANRVLGEPDHGRALVAFACREGAPVPMRIEALRILAEWREPDGQDRVFGDWRPLPRRNPLAVRGALNAAFDDLVQSAPDAVCRAAAEAATALDLPGAVPALARVAGDRDRRAATRDACLRALEELAPAETVTDVAAAVGQGDPARLRTTALRILALLAPDRSVPLLAAMVDDEDGELDARQTALASLGQVPGAEAAAVLLAWLDRLTDGTAPADIRLDILEAAAAHPDHAVKARLRAIEQSRDAGDPVADWRETLHGGDAARGRRIFSENPSVQCIRCHRVGKDGGEAGPPLDAVGHKGRDYLLAALITPGRDIAEGFENTVLTMRDGAVHAGIVQREESGTIELIDAAGETRSFAVADVSQRTVSGSAMPPVGDLLQKRDVRHLIAWLATLDATPGEGK